jgi:hypothetical protein
MILLAIHSVDANENKVSQFETFLMINEMLQRFNEFKTTIKKLNA